LTEAIGARGLRLSEQPFGTAPQARHFPQRNRIVSGLARAVVVVEAAAKSGSLITARGGADQGREVLAVPGHPFDARAAGCNMLIRDGATLVRHAADVIEALGLPKLRGQPAAGLFEQPAPAPARPQRSLQHIAALHDQILARLGPSPVAEDQLLRDVGADGGQMAPALMALELDGLIMRHAGGLISRAH
jgi:DNA processing protein